jgi:hypothetical protein
MCSFSAPRKRLNYGHKRLRFEKPIAINDFVSGEPYYHRSAAARDGWPRPAH